MSEGVSGGISQARSDARAMRQVRAALRGDTQLGAGDLAYRVYFAVMILIVVAAPLVRGLLLWLAEVLPAPHDPMLSAAAVLGGIGVWAAAGFAGWYLVPVRISLPELDLLFTSPLPRWRLLWRRSARLLLACVLAGWFLAACFIATRALQGQAVLPLVPSGVVWGMLLGASAAAIMLGAQAMHGTRWQQVRAQAQRVDVVSALVMTGDFSSAAARIGEPVRLGRNWRLNASVPGGRGVWLCVRRDLLGMARTPVRSVSAGLGLAAASVLAVCATAAQELSVTVVLGAAAQVLAYWALVSWCRGLRTAAEGAGSPPLLPYGVRGLLIRHAVVPGTAALVVCVAGALGAAALLAHREGAGVLVQMHLDQQVPLSVAALAGAGIALSALVLRLHGALKGPLPERLLAPIPTPVGDASGINIALWSADSLVLAMMSAALFFSLCVTVPWVAAVVLCGMLCGVLCWTEARVRRSVLLS